MGCLQPTSEPRATEHIREMVALIERLVARGVAYVAEDNVLFSPAAMDALPGAPRYGSLARRSLDEMMAGARVDVAPYKRDPMDFVLWKPSKPNEPGWPSPCGIATLGRPGWHIECSAMSMAKLLEPFGGGLACDDPEQEHLRHPRRRHRSRVPASRKRNRPVLLRLRRARMANVWMHNGFLQVEGEKMSKSLGNFVTIHELLRTDEFGGRNGRARRCGWRCCARITVSRSTGPSRRSRKRRSTLERWYDAIGDADAGRGRSIRRSRRRLCDDLNTPAALAELHRLGGRGSRPRREPQAF